MKISDIQTIHLVYRYPDGRKWRWSGGYFDSWSSVLVQVITEDGLTGLGEVYQGSCVSAAVPAFVDYFKRWLVGEDPDQIEYLWQKVYNLSAFWNRHGFPIGVLGAIDIALYDLVGKAAGIPVHRLLGGAAHPQQRMYCSAGCTDSAEQLVSEVCEALSNGFKAYKWRVVDPNQAGSIMTRLREAAGQDFDLMVDAVQGSAPTPWEKPLVIALARAIEPWRPRWLEEPFRIEDPQSYAELRRFVSYPIAGGESVTSLPEVESFLAVGALDVLQPDLTVAGGFTLARRMAVLAEAQQIEIAMHCWGGAVSLMANLHFGFSQPACVFVEYPQYPNSLRDELLCEPLAVKDGYVTPSSQPGLGVRLTEEVVRKYRATDTDLAGLVFELR